MVTKVAKRQIPEGTIGILVGVERVPELYPKRGQTHRGVVWLSNGNVFRLGVEFLDHIDGAFSSVRKCEVDDCLIAYVSAGSPRMT